METSRVPIPNLHSKCERSILALMSCLPKKHEKTALVYLQFESSPTSSLECNRSGRTKTTRAGYTVPLISIGVGQTGSLHADWFFYYIYTLPIVSVRSATEKGTRFSWHSVVSRKGDSGYLQ